MPTLFPELVPDVVVGREFGVSPMTLFRRDADASLAFPKAVVIRGRKYRIRADLEAFKAGLIAAAASGDAKTSMPVRPHRGPPKKPREPGGYVRE